MTKLTEMPDGVRGTLLGAAVLIGVLAGSGNLGHVYDAVRHAGQVRWMSAALAVLPDVLLILCLFKLRYDPRALAAWLGLTWSIGFIGWASVVTSKKGLHVDSAETTTRRIIGLSPLVFAIIAASLIETRPRPPAQQTPRGETNRERRGTGRARPTTAVAPSPPSSNSGPGPVAPAKPPAAAPPVAAGPAGPETPPPGRPLHSVRVIPDDLAAAVLTIRGRGQRVTRDRLKDELSIGTQPATEALALLKSAGADLDPISSNVREA
jgi:hypothetical protein